MKIDYKHFKKMHSDDECTTLKHKDGHELKIAHSKLDDKLRKELDKLPVHKEKGYANGGPVVKLPGSEDKKKKIQEGFKGALGFAEGGNVPADFEPGKDYSKQPLPGDPMASQAPPMPKEDQAGAEPSRGTILGTLIDHPETIKEALSKAYPARGVGDEGTKPSQNPSNIVQDAPGTLGEPRGLATPSPQTPQEPVAPSPAVAEASVAEPVQEQVAPVRASTPQQAAQDTKSALQIENQAFEQDLLNGHITPKTYASMYHDESTLGKIGMLFGMLLSGAGSGLSHQPNAVMELMNKEIERDLEAQKQSKTNAQNFYKLNQQNLLNEAQITKLQQEGVLNEAQAKQMGVETDTKAFALAQAQMLQSSYHSLVDKVNKMPEGPQKEAAKQQLGVIYPQVAAKINNINDQAAGAAAYYKQLFGQGGGSGSESEFQQRTTGLRMLGDVGQKRADELESKHFPGFKGQASIPLTAGDREAIEGGVELDKALSKFRKWAAAHSGSVNPKDIIKGQAMAAELQGAYRQATKGGTYKESESNFISKIVDSDPTKFFNSIRVLPKLDAVLAMNRDRLNQLAKSKGFEGYEGQAETKTVNGVTYKRGPNGEAIRVK